MCLCPRKPERKFIVAELNVYQQQRGCMRSHSRTIHYKGNERGPVTYSIVDELQTQHGAKELNTQERVRSDPNRQE
jgi:hypothetical protein